MEILVFELANENSLLPKLRKHFPSVAFKKYDPSQELECRRGDLVVIETIKDIQRVILVDDIQDISPAKALRGSGMLMTLRILLRIGSIKSARVIAVPEGYPEDTALEELKILFEALLSSRS